MHNAQLEEAAALPEEEKQKKEKKFSLKSEIISWLWTIGIALAIVFVVNTFIARVMTVEGESMTNTLQNRERIITTSLYGELKRGDIVVIRRENDVPAPFGPKKPYTPGVSSTLKSSSALTLPFL